MFCSRTSLLLFLVLQIILWPLRFMLWPHERLGATDIDDNKNVWHCVSLCFGGEKEVHYFLQALLVRWGFEPCPGVCMYQLLSCRISVMVKKEICVNGTQRNSNNMSQLNVGATHTAQSMREHVTRVTAWRPTRDRCVIQICLLVHVCMCTLACF